MCDAGEHDRARADRGALLDDERRRAAVRGAPEVGASRGDLPRIDVVLDRRRRRRSPRRRGRRRWRRSVTSRPTAAVGAQHEPGGGVVGHGGYPSGAVPSPDSTRPLRGAVLGLGMIGRHHARLLQASPRVAFAGAVDPGGDRFGAVHDPGLVFGDRSTPCCGRRARTSRSSPCPTEEHVAAVSQLAAAGVHVLVEKPLAATADRGAGELIDVVRGGRRPRRGRPRRALQPRAAGAARAACRRASSAQVFLVATERIGPFPDRVRDVGVVKDLATHDLDLVRWLGGAPVERVRRRDPAPDGPRARGPRPRHRAARERRRRFNCVVDWLSPDQGAPHPRPRRARHARGRHAHRRPDLLRATAQVRRRTGRRRSRCAASPRATSTRYALTRREPLLVELEAFCDLLRGRPRAPRSSRSRRAWRPSCVAEAVLASARAGETVALVEARHVKAVVVALGKIGLPLAAQIARAGHEVVGCDIDARVVELVNAGAAAVPRRGGPGRGAGRGRRRRAPARHDRHHRRGRRGPRARRRRAAAGGRRRRPARLGLARRRRRRHRRAACRPGTTVVGRDDAAGGHHAHPRRARAGRATAACARRTTSSASSAPSASTAAASSATSRPTPSSSAASAPPARRAASSSTAAFLDAEVLADGLGRGGRADQARRDDLPRRQHRAGQRVRALRRPHSASTSTASSTPPTRSPSATSTAPASRSAATASRSTRASTSTGDPDARLPGAAREVNEAMPALRRRPARAELGGLDRDARA